MDMTRMMELVSLQRHDFLNHLQVVSGLLQLKRDEQARDYINKVAVEIRRLSRVVHLKVPEAAAAILLAHHLAADYQVEMKYTVEANLGGCSIPGPELGRALEMVLGYAVKCLAPLENEDRELFLEIRSSGEDGYLLLVRFKRPPAESGHCDKSIILNASGMLSKLGGGLDWSDNEGQREISIKLPAGKA